MGHIKSRIVVVEDNEPDVCLLENALDNAGVCYELVNISDGETARSYIAAATARLPDLFLVDMNLPKVDGFELLRLIRLEARLEHVPVVVWSSARAPDHMAALTKLGVTSYIDKPSSLDAFFEIGHTIRSILERRQSAA